jgi:hypothetical protein
MPRKTKAVAQEPTVAPVVASTVAPAVAPVVAPAVAPVVAPVVASAVAPATASTVAPAVAPASAPKKRATKKPAAEPATQPVSAPVVASATVAPVVAPAVASATVAPAPVVAGAKTKAKRKASNSAKPKAKEPRSRKRAKTATEPAVGGTLPAQPSSDATSADATSADAVSGSEEGSDNRYFKCLFEGKTYGRICGKKPKQAANKCFTSLLKHLKKSGKQYAGEKLNFSIVECTRGSKHSEYLYSGERTQLADPVAVTIAVKNQTGGTDNKVVTYRHKNYVRKVKKT